MARAQLDELEAGVKTQLLLKGIMGVPACDVYAMVPAEVLLKLIDTARNRIIAADKTQPVLVISQNGVPECCVQTTLKNAVGDILAGMRNRGVNAQSIEITRLKDSLFFKHGETVLGISQLNVESKDE
jgi:hypothetical protein